MAGGNTYDKYQNRRRITGRLSLDNQLHEDALHLLAEGNEKGEVVEMLGGRITVDEIDALLASPLGQRRFQFIQQAKARQEFEPSTPDECLDYVKRSLVALSKNGDTDKVRIDALKALADVAIDERDTKPQASAPRSDDAALKKLKEAFGRGG